MKLWRFNRISTRIYQLNRNCVSFLLIKLEGWLVVWLVGFLTSSSRLSPRQSVWQFNVLPHMRHSWETMTSVSAGHIILTPTQPVGSGRPERGWNPGPPDQESRALPQSYCATPSWRNALSYNRGRIARYTGTETKTERQTGTDKRHDIIDVQTEERKVTQTNRDKGVEDRGNQMDNEKRGGQTSMKRDKKT